jgi:hypothetical protein
MLFPVAQSNIGESLKAEVRKMFTVWSRTLVLSPMISLLLYSQHSCKAFTVPDTINPFGNSVKSAEISQRI